MINLRITPNISVVGYPIAPLTTMILIENMLSDSKVYMTEPEFRKMIEQAALYYAQKDASSQKEQS